MTRIGFHASHEQHPPSDLLEFVRIAEQVGFDEAMCSDHFAPWLTSQGHSGFAWSWIAAALALTRYPIGLVTAPGQRYHPVIAAQALATVEEMFPGRTWAALGSGEALNEHVTGDEWPPKPERDERLVRSADVMRRLLSGEKVNADGLVRVHEARLWTRPEIPPPMLGAAISPRTAALIAPWADGMITVGGDPNATRRTRESYRRAGGTGRTLLQVHVSLAPTREEALAAARDQWAQGTVPPRLMPDLQQPEDFGRHADTTDAKLDAAVIIGSDEAEVAGRIAAAAAGFDGVFLHYVGTDQRAFLQRCEDHLLPELRRLL